MKTLLAISESAIRSGITRNKIANLIPKQEVELVFFRNSCRGIDFSKYSSVILWINFDCEVGINLFNLIPNLVAVATTSTGTDHMDLLEMKRRGIDCLKLSQNDELLEKVTATVDHSLALIFGLYSGALRYLNTALQMGSPLGFTRTGQFSSMTIGLVGVGRIGFAVGNALESIGCKILYAETSPSRITFISEVKPTWRETSLTRVLAEADLVTIHANYTQGSPPILSSTVLDNLKIGSYIVNTARASLVDAKKICNLLEQKILFGYATDDDFLSHSVDSKIETKFQELRKSGLYFSTPHIGGASKEAAATAETIVFDKVLNLIHSHRY